MSALAAVFIIQACNNNQRKTHDSIDSAEHQNDHTMLPSEESSADFLVETTSGGMLEIELGKLAQINALSQRVKNFGTMMIKDHTEANKRIAELASSKNIVLPNIMGEKDQKMYNDLKAKKGADFDKDYMDMMLEGHKNNIDNFEKEAKNPNDLEISDLANSLLPILNVHADSAKAISNAIKK